MNISSVSNSSYQPNVGGDTSSKIKQSFQKLGSALESGNLSDAKDALAQLQKNAPADASKNNPMSAKMEALNKAVESGDIKSAQNAYADIKKTMSQRPSGGETHPGGEPPSGGKPSSNSAVSSSSTKIYDKMDANKDTKVSSKEEDDYYLDHPQEKNQDSATNQIDQGYFNVTA